MSNIKIVHAKSSDDQDVGQMPSGTRIRAATLPRKTRAVAATSGNTNFLSDPIQADGQQRFSTGWCVSAMLSVPNQPVGKPVALAGLEHHDLVARLCRIPARENSDQCLTSQQAYGLAACRTIFVKIEFETQ